VTCSFGWLVQGAEHSDEGFSSKRKTMAFLHGKLKFDQSTHYTHYRSDMQPWMAGLANFGVRSRAIIMVFFRRKEKTMGFSHAKFGTEM
jgi:hypothetical protein